ncbi:MAG: DUF4215 domain-containing protein [Deltaproteobacteria bacterium]|nr:DUF4215 domain-containing protein [Deltaproteobacteria bacterium]
MKTTNRAFVLCFMMILFLPVSGVAIRKEAGKIVSSTQKKVGVPLELTLDLGAGKFCEKIDSDSKPVCTPLDTKRSSFVWKKGNKKLDLSYKKLSKGQYQMTMIGLPSKSLWKMNCIGSFCHIDWTTICFPCLDGFFSYCGNGTVEGDEQCDDGNNIFLDGCTPQCRFEHNCGNGILENGEECDDGNQRSGDGCTFDCKMQECGNRIIEAYETCDDGNEVSGDGCSNRCVIECILSSRSVTSYHCPSTCGNGVFERGEECDDGNLVSDDGCSAVCESDEPITEPDPELVTCYACSVGGSCEAVSAEPAVCLLFYDDPTCGGDCLPAPVCGNEIVELGEDCDDGNLIDDDLCTNACRIPDAIIEDCADPEAASLEPGTRLREYPDSTHISRCETEDSVRYIICGNDGEITVGINGCEEGVPCEEGACVDDPLPESICTDTDTTDDADLPGRTTVAWSDGRTDVTADFCNVDQSAVYQNHCDDSSDEISPWVLTPCGAGETCYDPPGVVEGACVPGDPVTSECTDTDTLDDSDLPGTTTVAWSDGRIDTWRDFCNPERTGVWQNHCDDSSDEISLWVLETCDPGEVCIDPPGVVEGACVSTCSCSRTTATATTSGFVTGGDCVVQHDLCRTRVDGSFELIQYECGIDGRPAESATTLCPDGCEDGLCL